MKFVLIFGPHAVGKMTVGYELEKITGLKLFHNHMTIELVSPFLTVSVNHESQTASINTFFSQTPTDTTFTQETIEPEKEKRGFWRSLRLGLLRGGFNIK